MFMPPLPPAMPPLPPGGPQGVLSFWSSMLLSSWACMNRLFSSCLFLIPSSCFFILSIIIISSSVLLFCSASNIWPMLASLCSHMALVCSLWEQREMKLEEDKLIAQMEYARYEHETET